MYKLSVSRNVQKKANGAVGATPYSPERKFWVKEIVWKQFGKTEWWC